MGGKEEQTSTGDHETAGEVRPWLMNYKVGLLRLSSA